MNKLKKTSKKFLRLILNILKKIKFHYPKVKYLFLVKGYR